MDKKKIKTVKTNTVVEKDNKNLENSKLETNRTKSEDYGYDFVPTLDNSLNIDEQKVKAKRLENIEKKRGK
ncbi:MAG: hypothetical protein IKK84_04245 [Clostridia bacterium]|nr:hypothetical protein [Clostridia bacterium]